MDQNMVLSALQGCVEDEVAVDLLIQIDGKNTKELIAAFITEVNEPAGHFTIRDYGPVHIDQLLDYWFHAN